MEGSSYLTKPAASKYRDLPYAGHASQFSSIRDPLSGIVLAGPLPGRPEMTYRYTAVPDGPSRQRQISID